MVIGALGTVTEGLIKGLEHLENKRAVGNHPDYYIIWIGQNTEKILETRCHSKISERPSAKTDVRNLQGVKYNA